MILYLILKLTMLVEQFVNKTSEYTNVFIDPNRIDKLNEEVIEKKKHISYN